MDAYKKAIGSKRKIISNASKWIKEKGKQTYKFPGDKTLHNPRCQLCEKLCYPAEKITHNGTPYHKNCLRCIYCGKKKAPADVSPIGETTFVCDQHKHKVLKSKKSKSKVSVQKPAEKKEQHSKNDNETEKETKSRLSRNPKMGVDQKEKTTESSGLTKIEEGVEWRAEGRKQVYNYPEDVKGPKKRIDPRCHKCGKTVYPAEKFTYEMIPYHRNCVRCLECKIKLTPSNATPFGDEDFLCNNHFQKVIGKINLRSRSRAPAANETNKTFKTTEDLSKGIKWSRSGKKQAYKYLEDLKEKPNPRCNFCGKTTYPAETVTYNSIPYHTACFRCLRCGKKLIGGDANPFGEENYLCNNHYNGVLMEIGTETKSKISKTEKTTTIVNVGLMLLKKFIV
ncbi:Zinc-binding domain present in Lin-11, Isl-1, Mec-3, partial [Bonamia ostreae]